MNFASYFKHTTKFFRKLQNWAHISIWIIINHIDYYQHIFYETNFQKYFPFTHICCHISYRLSDTKIIMTSQRHYARNPQNHAYIFIVHGLAHPASELWLIIPNLLSIKTKIIHGVIRFKNDVPCLVRSEALRGNCQITRFMGPTWGPPGSCRLQMGPMLAPWALLYGLGYVRLILVASSCLIYHKVR